MGGETWKRTHGKERERESGEVGGGEGRGGREGRRRKSSREYNSQPRAVRMMGSCGGLQSPCKAFILSVPSVWMCHSAYFYLALRRFWGLQPCPGTHPGILRLKIIKEGWEEERRAKKKRGGQRLSHADGWGSSHACSAEVWLCKWRGEKGWKSQ